MLTQSDIMKTIFVGVENTRSVGKSFKKNSLRCVRNGSRNTLIESEKFVENLVRATIPNTRVKSDTARKWTRLVVEVREVVVLRSSG